MGYDYVYDHSGQLLLIHPGLAEPEKLMNLLTANGSAAGFEMNPEALSSASDSVGDLEDPLYERMLFLLQDVTRPEIAPEDAVEDLIILTKQSVPFEDMVEVLSSMLICRATEEMRAALWELSSQIPRWLNLSVSLVQ